MQITYAILFDNVMRSIWGDNDPPHDFIVKSIADKIRGTARVNPENALEVLDMFGPNIARFVDARAAEGDETDTAIFTVKFWDESSILIVAKRGIGSAVEVI